MKSMKVNKAYSEFAKVYDLMGADRHSIMMVEYSLEIFKRFNIDATSGLDLCCGTGTAIKLFIDHGLTMSGLDGSAQMLAIAVKKLRRHKVMLYHKPLPRFRLLRTDNSKAIQTFDLVTSFYDSLNYMKNMRELKAAFRSVQQHLNPGGWFIFDMNTAHALKTIWGQQVYAEAHDDLAWIWDNKYDRKRKAARLDITFFQRTGRVWERFDETHVEHGYSNTHIKQLLKETGFSVKGLYKCFTFEKADRQTNRICVIAQKKNKR